MNTKEELKKLLKRINSAEDVEEIKPEIKEELRGVDPTELSRAEQELAEEEDIGVEEIRNLCGPHLEILEEENLEGDRKEIQEREKGHPRSVLEGEHDVLLERLDELSEIIDELDSMTSFEELEDYIDQLKDISRHLLDAESHHNREEEALFPEVEKKGLTGPTEVMREEHEDYLEKKRALGDLIENRDELSFERFAQKLKRIGTYLVEGMRDHIYKENNILYPAAGDVLSEEEWSEIKRKSDEMGYAFFSPVQGNRSEEDKSSQPGRTDQSVGRDAVWGKLKKVEDPEFGTSIVDMDLIDDVSIYGGTVSVDFHLTAPVCPPPFVLNMAKRIKQRVSELGEVSEVDVTVKEHNRAEEINEEIKGLEENNGEFN
jgi:hypothetical protein